MRIFLFFLCCFNIIYFDYFLFRIHIASFCFKFCISIFFLLLSSLFSEKASFGFNQYFLLCVKKKHVFTYFFVVAQQHNNLFVNSIFIYLILCWGEDGVKSKVWMRKSCFKCDIVTWSLCKLSRFHHAK